MLGTALLNDKHRLGAGFRALRDQGYAAMLRAGFTTEDGFDRLRDHYQSREQYVFYIDQAELRAFDAEGNLCTDLHLYWAGDVSTIVSALRESGLRSTEPPPEQAILVHRSANAVPTTFHERCSELGRRYGVETRKPPDREDTYANLAHHASEFRSWVRDSDPATFALMEQDRDLCPHDDVYERYVGFGIPEHRRTDTPEPDAR